MMKREFQNDLLLLIHLEIHILFTRNDYIKSFNQVLNG